MRKVVSLVLALLLAAGLCACSGDDDQITALAEVYNRLAPMYNEAYDNAEANGWMEDAQTAAELNAVGSTLGPLGESLSGDRSDLEDVDIEGLIKSLEELEPSLQEPVDRVSEPYGG